MACRVAICDDSKTDAEYVAGLVCQWAKERGSEAAVQVFPGAESFLFNYAEDKLWDILLLDIEMGDMDGVELAKTVRRDNEGVQIVFITGYSDYIAEGYEVAALHYLMKPVSREKLFAVLDRALEKRQQQDRCLSFAAGGETVRIPLYEIRYLEVRLNYVTIHAKQAYTVKRTLRDIEKELDGRFARAGRSMIVNLQFVRRVTKNEVHLADGTTLPLPRGAYEQLNRAIINSSF